MDAGDRLLAHVAALGVADRLFETGLERDRLAVELAAEGGDAALDAPGLEGLVVAGPRSGRLQRGAQRRGAARGRDDQHGVLLEAGIRAQLHLRAGEAERG